MLKGLSNAGNVSNIVSDVDVARARLQLLESKAQEARREVADLRGSANLDDAIINLPEAESKLTILEGQAQNAHEKLALEY